MIQLQFLNKILSSKNVSLITENNLTQDYFSDYINEFKFIKSHIDTYGNIPDLESFLNKFSNFEVLKVEEKESFLLEELYKDYKTRLLASTFNEVRTLVMNGNPDEALTLITNTINENSSKNNAIKCVDILRDTSRYNAYVERTQDFGKYYVKTGFKELDDLIGGWDREEELATIAARTNNAKSWILLKCAAAACEQGLNVGIYSGEMSERKVGYRLDTLIGHISNGGLVHGNVGIQTQYKQYIDNLPNMFKGSLKVLTPQMISGPAGVGALRSFIERENIDILFVDQHSLLEDDRKAKDPVTKASNISRDLKNLQVMKRIPIISVSQQNRVKPESGVADSSNISQSDRIAQDSTLILFLEKKDDIIKMHLVKSRDSENNKDLTYSVDLNTGLFTYVPSEDDAIGGNCEEDYENRYVQVESSGESVF